jgi:large subunit ribosomal protein L16
VLAPKRVKYRFSFRGRRKGLATRGTELQFGDFGLKALEPAWVSARQIEAARRAMTHHTKRGGRIWIRVFPDKPVTKKPPEVRMGSGKGAIDHYAAVVKPGVILFEIGGVPEKLALEAMELAAMKLPIDVKIIERRNL